MMTMISEISKNTATFSTLKFPILVIISWLIISIIAFNIAYKKVGVDN